MRTYEYIVILAMLVISASCNGYKTNGRQNSIQRIVFATGGCYGTCPIQVIDIDSELTIKYGGIKYTDSIGFYKGVISKEFWDTLNIKFDRINYSSLDSSYEQSIDDLSTEIYIYSNINKVKHIHGQSGSLPDSVMSIYEWLLSSIKQMKIIKTTDSLKFPTIIEKTLRIPSPPSYSEIKFTPPKINGK